MKRFILLIAFILITLNPITQIDATQFSYYLPGGKNYIDPANFYQGMNQIESNDDMRVKPNSTYTFSFPPNTMLEDPYIIIQLDSGYKLEGLVADLPECTMDLDRTYCTFTTTTDEFVSITLSAQGLDQFIAYYGFQDIQLEEGSTWTEYEPYSTGYLDVNNPQFQGVATFVKAYYETITVQQIIDDHILVLDDIDGDITDMVQVVSDNYTENMYQAGQYEVVLQASDHAGNTETMTLSIIVKDEVAPLINGPDSVSVSVDDTLLLAEILSENYTSVDGHDGAIDMTIQSDQYSAYSTVIGTYDVSLFAVDGAGNSITKLIHIQVQDQVAPTLITDPHISVTLSNPKTLTDLILSLDLTDNYDPSNLINVEVVDDQYTDQSNQPGTYTATIRLSDLSGNMTETPLNITVVDDIAPVIIGPETMSVSYLLAPTIDDLIESFVVSDNIDSLVSSNLVIIQDDYSTREEETGTFLITVSLTDTALNTAQHSIQITLLDDQAPTIYIDNYMITVTSEASFTPKDALQLLIENNEIIDDDYVIETVYDEYTDNQDVAGTYHYSLKFTNSKGDSAEKDFLIRVTDMEQTVSNTVFQSVRYIVVYSGLIGFAIVIVMRNKK